MTRLRAIAFVVVACASYACSTDDAPRSPVASSCTFSVAAPVTSFGPSGGTGTASVTTTNGCAWTAASQVDWIRVGSESHTGSGSVTFTVTESAEPAPRTASLSIASQPLAISQEAAAGPPPAGCSVALSASPDDYERDGGPGQLRISTAAGCPWALSQDASWLTIRGPLQGSGPATLALDVAANDDLPARRLSIRSGSASLVISQPGQGDCSFQVSPIGAELPRVAYAADVTVQTSRGCRWTAASDSSWLHLSSAGGTGSGKVTYQTDFNPETARSVRRVGRVAIRWAAPTAGQNVSVVQWGDCSTLFALNDRTGPVPVGASFRYDNPTRSGALTVGADGGEFRFFVLTEPFMGCAWTAEASDGGWVQWIFPRLHGVNGGDGDLHFVVPPNPGANDRTAVFLIDQHPLTIVQRGR